MSDSPEPSERSSPEGERFTRLLMQHQRHLYAFLFSVTQDRQAAEDLTQDVSLILWRKFSTFQEGTNFNAWAFRITRLEA